MRTTVHTVPGVIYDGDKMIRKMIRKDLLVRITKSSWGVSMSISDDEKIMLQIQLDHPSILKRLREVLKK